MTCRQRQVDAAVEASQRKVQRTAVTRRGAQLLPGGWDGAQPVFDRRGLQRKAQGAAPIGAAIEMAAREGGWSRVRHSETLCFATSPVNRVFESEAGDRAGLEAITYGGGIAY